MNIHYDKVNHWLHIGNFTVMISDWLGWFNKEPSLNTCTLFQVMWDRGAFWAFDLDKKEDKSIPYMDGRKIETVKYTQYSGQLNCFFQIIILGLGFRYSYKKKAVVAVENRAADKL
jgi:hypothetical protein